MMNTAGLEWFGLPERNTLRPLCVVLLVLSMALAGLFPKQKVVGSSPTWRGKCRGVQTHSRVA